MLTGLSDTTPFAWLIAAYLIFGIGFGAVNPPITNTAVSGMPAAQAGVAAAVASTSRQVGAAFGVAVIGVAATAGIRGSLAIHLALASHPGWWLVTACSALVLIVGFLSTTRRAERTVRLTAALFGAPAQSVPRSVHWRRGPKPARRAQ
jgi:MFS family permease